MKTQLAKILRKKSQKLNLFSTGDREKLEDKHIPDSLAVMDFIEFEPGSSVVDIGTGGGLPGLALAIENPEISFTLIDARQKKINADLEVAEELGLKNVHGVAGRFEELAHQSELREKFDFATARAVASLPTLLEYAAGFLKDGGIFIAWKSVEYKEELEDSRSAQDLLGLEFEESYLYKLPGGEERRILKFIKTGKLDKKYPRRDGVPKAKPL